MSQQKKLKHSKFKNTGVLFELLVKQVTADVLAGKEPTTVSNIIKEHFAEGTELNKELKIYRLISEERTKTELHSEKMLEICIKAKSKIDEKKLAREKFKLVKEIKDNWNLEDFMRGSISNYKLLASIYKVLEESSNASVEIDPKESYQARQFIIEHLTSTKKKEVMIESDADRTLQFYKEQSEDLRLLSYKLLVDRFNEKYSILNESQKKLIKEYIYNVSNTNSLKAYIDKEIPTVKNKLISLTESTVSDKVLKIKIKSAANQLDSILENKFLVKDSHISSMLIAYEIVKELENNK
jgi:hypothetical protein